MAAWIEKIAAFIAAKFRQYWVLIAGAGVYHIFSWVYDNPIWMGVELRWHGTGVVVMMALAFVINTVLLVFFRNKRTDFILWSALDEFSEKESEYHAAYTSWTSKRTPWRLFLLVSSYIPVKLTIFLLWLLKKAPRLGDAGMFCFLSIFEDPFITTMYLRHGYRDGLRIRDYAVYLASSALSIGYWAVRNGLVVELVLRPIFKA